MTNKPKKRKEHEEERRLQIVCIRLHSIMRRVCVITATTYTAAKLLEMRLHVPTLTDPTIAKDFVINATLVLTVEKKSRI